MNFVQAQRHLRVVQRSRGFKGPSKDGGKKGGKRRGKDKGKDFGGKDVTCHKARAESINY